ncbi:MAG: acetate--CoA ligase family protein [Syntrophales bacterium]|nr:acetate--CoA ligase family protein [Syntrophales bacterium]
MKVSEIFDRAKKEGRRALSEAEAKLVLKSYGIPVVEEKVVSSAEEAALAARDFGFPVVLKGLGANLTHKTERNLVHVNIRSEENVRIAAQEIIASAGEDLEGFLLQPMIRGKRELVAGLFHDPNFGPVVMFGLGGIFTEALRDVSFRLVPTDPSDIITMMEELKASAILGPFRGEAAVVREDVVKTIAGLSKLAEDFKDVTEVDINPLIVSPDGHLTAVDALIVLGDRQSSIVSRPPIHAKHLFKMFFPRSIVFVGASATPGKWGNMLFTNCVAGGYEGKIFLVNPKGGKIAGRDVYKQIADIPDPVDLAIVSIPAEKIIPLLPELSNKGIKYMVLITSGFSETGDQGRKLEEELVTAAHKAGIVILGPNTMGVCNPHAKFYCTGTPCWPPAGSIALVSQSGNLGTQLLTFAEMERIGIRAFSGSGNEAMITIEDYLDALVADTITKTVVLYIESIKDGPRFFQTARAVSKQKPIIVLKGGRTSEGSKAAASHTGAMASNIKVFTAACRQAGIVLADQPMDLLDLSAAFSSLPLPKGKRVAIMTLGGGWGVVATDLCVEYGLSIPHLTPDLIAVIDELLPPYWSKENPIDLVGEFDPAIPMKVVEALAKWDHCDAILHLGAVGRYYFVRNMVRAIENTNPDIPKELAEAQIKVFKQAEREFFAHTIRLMEKYGKPIIGVRLLEDEDTKTVTEIPGYQYKGVSFLTPERAVKTLAKMAEYSEWLKKEKALY